MSIVVLWTITSALGLGLSVWALYQRILDIRALGARANGRRVQATAHLVKEILRGIAHLGFFAVGIALWEAKVELSWTGAVFIYVNVALVANSLIDLATRHLLYQTRNTEPDLRSNPDSALPPPPGPADN